MIFLTGLSRFMADITIVYRSKKKVSWGCKPTNIAEGPTLRQNSDYYQQAYQATYEVG